MKVNQEAIKWLEQEENRNSEMILFMNNVLDELPGTATIEDLEFKPLTKHDYTDIDFTWLYG